jgi:acyl carrier protein
MTREQLGDHILRALGRVAPEARGRALMPDVNLRDALDLDSMDLLNFAIALQRELGVEIAEADYPRLATLESLTDFLAEKLP